MDTSVVIVLLVVVVGAGILLAFYFRRPNDGDRVPRDPVAMLGKQRGRNDRGLAGGVVTDEEDDPIGDPADQRGRP